MASALKDILHMVSHFIKKPKQVGAIIPSSHFLARRMMNILDLERAKTVVELGAGTGAITNELLRRVKLDAKVIIVDSNQDAVVLLQRRLPMRENLFIHEGDAQELRGILKKYNFESADAIISSLPYATLGENLTRNILSAAADILAPDGCFVAFQYTPFLQKTLEKYFEIQSVSLELRNFPPAIVYECLSRDSARSTERQKDCA